MWPREHAGRQGVWNEWGGLGRMGTFITEHYLAILTDTPAPHDDSRPDPRASLAKAVTSLQGVPSTCSPALLTCFPPA